MTDDTPMLAKQIQAPIYNFTIKRRNGTYEDVNSCFVEFTPHHVIFRDTNGRIDYGLHASELIDITQGEYA